MLYIHLSRALIVRHLIMYGRVNLRRVSSTAVERTGARRPGLHWARKEGEMEKMPEGSFIMSYISHNQAQPWCWILQCSAMVELKVSFFLEPSTPAFWLITLLRCSMAASKFVSLQQCLSRHFNNWRCLFQVTSRKFAAFTFQGVQLNKFTSRFQLYLQASCMLFFPWTPVLRMLKLIF